MAIGPPPPVVQAQALELLGLRFSVYSIRGWAEGDVSTSDRIMVRGMHLIDHSWRVGPNFPGRVFYPNDRYFDDWESVSVALDKLAEERA